MNLKNMRECDNMSSNDDDDDDGGGGDDDANMLVKGSCMR